MSDTVRSISIEIEDERGATTVVIRDPFGAPRLYTAGPARAADVQRILEALGLFGSPMPPPSSPASVPARGSSRLAATPIGAISVRAPPMETTSDDAGTTLRAVVEAVLRTGRRAQTSTVDEAVRAADEVLAGRNLPAVARLLDHVELALRDTCAVDSAALALVAAGEAARVIETGSPSAVAAELAGSEAETASFESRVLVEVGRHRERGRAHWETRLFADVDSGELVRECGSPSQGGLSLGPAGRRLVVSLASVLESTEPRRVRISQYEYQPAATPAELERSLSLAHRSVAVPPDVVASPIRLIAMPRIVFLAPDFVEVCGAGEIVLKDGRGDELPVLRSIDPGAADALEAMVENDSVRVRALSGSLRVTSAGVGFHPWSAIVATSEGLRYAQLTL